ncbi:MAG: hypothetical protein JWO56_2272 [Acidobacteria bacterium]|nr:hypothetical protein [Acidobacteriota bacterium]
MTVARTARPTTRATLALAALAAICVVMARSGVFQRNPDMLAWGVTFDLTISIPLLYWFFVVRPGHAKPLTMAPLFVAGVTLAALVIPRGHHQFLEQLRFVSAPLEIVTLVLIGRRLLRMRGAETVEGDAYAKIDAATRAVLGDGKTATFVAMEVTILYYSLFAWRTPEPAGDETITLHRESGWGSILACILTLLAAESIGLHLALQLWFRPIVVWSVTALDVYGVLWLLGDYHALRLRPSVASGDTLHIRHGLRWSIDVPLANIAAIDPVAAEDEWKGKKHVLSLRLFDEPRYLIRLREPQTANGIAGITRTVDTIALRPDDDERFRRLVPVHHSAF